jgi:hypothetical protein
MRTRITLLALLALLMWRVDLTRAEETTQPAPASGRPTTSEAGKHPGGCMPDGGCCGQGECARAAVTTATDKDAALEGGCPCQKMRKAAQAAEKPS